MACRYFATTGCYRSDCPYAHHASASPPPPRCHFYAAGTCTAGASCRFRHGDDTAAPDSAPEPPPPLTAPAYHPPPSLHSEEHFPSLGGSPRAAMGLSSGSGLAIRLAMDALTRAFPGVPDNEVLFCLETSGGRRGDAATLLSARNALSPVPGVLDSAITIAAVPSASATGSPRSGARGSAAGAALARAIARNMERVTTGSSVAALYAAARGEAEGLARARNDAFYRASVAFRSGDGRAAAQWSGTGREIEARMQAAQTAAAARIFSERNDDGGGSVMELTMGGGAAPVSVNVLDLHGLHPQEGIDFATEALAASRGIRGGPRWTVFLSGARGHSASRGKGGGSLHGALLAHLQSAAGVVEVHEPPPGGLIVVCTE